MIGFKYRQFRERIPGANIDYLDDLSLLDIIFAANTYDDEMALYTSFTSIYIYVLKCILITQAPLLTFADWAFQKGLRKRVIAQPTGSMEWLL